MKEEWEAGNTVSIAKLSSFLFLEEELRPGSIAGAFVELYSRPVMVTITSRRKILGVNL